MSFFNQRRLRDYPRLILGTMVVVLALNILFRDGWMGAAKQIIGCDFITFYSVGVLFGQDPGSLYDFEKQGMIQRELLEPTVFEGIMPFNYPPYVAQAISFIAKIPMAAAFAVWSLLTIAFVTLAVRLMSQFMVPAWLQDKGLSFVQLLIITCSFAPFFEGLQVGQNHGLTLLLVTAMILLSLKKSFFAAGLIAGLTIYKPHLAIGFLIIWFVWREYKALAGYAIISLIWVGWFVLNHGTSLLQAYLSAVPMILKMPYLEGAGGFLEVTPYGFLITLLPTQAWQGIMVFTQILFFLLCAGIAWVAFRDRLRPLEQRDRAFILATLLPLLAAPHMLLHDLIIIVPALILWASRSPSKKLLFTCIAIYLGTFFIPLIAHWTGVAFLSLIPISLFFIYLNDFFIALRQKQSI